MGTKTAKRWVGGWVGATADSEAAFLRESSELLPEGLSSGHLLLPLLLPLYSVLEVGTRFDA